MIKENGFSPSVMIYLSSLFLIDKGHMTMKYEYPNERLRRNTTVMNGLQYQGKSQRKKVRPALHNSGLECTFERGMKEVEEKERKSVWFTSSCIAKWSVCFDSNAKSSNTCKNVLLKVISILTHSLDCCICNAQHMTRLNVIRCVMIDCFVLSLCSIVYTSFWKSPFRWQFYTKITQIILDCSFFQFKITALILSTFGQFHRHRKCKSP